MAGRPAWMRFPSRPLTPIPLPVASETTPVPVPVALPQLRPVFSFLPSTAVSVPPALPPVVAQPRPRPPLIVAPALQQPVLVSVAPPPPPPPPVAAPPPPQPSTPMPPVVEPATTTVLQTAMTRPASPITAPPPPPPHISPTRSPIQSPPPKEATPPPSPIRPPVPPPATSPPIAAVRSSPPTPQLSTPVATPPRTNKSPPPPPSPVQEPNYENPQSPLTKNTPPTTGKPAESATRETVTSPQTVKSVDKTANSPKIHPLSNPPSPLTLPAAKLRNNNNGVPEIEQKNVMIQRTIDKPMETHQSYNNGDTSTGKRDQKPKENNNSQKKPNSEEPGFKMIIAGENKGAIMEIGSSQTKTRTLGNGSSSNGDQSIPLNNNEMKKKSMAIQSPFAAYLNSNVQGLNNSIMHNCSFRSNDPGIRLTVKRTPSGRYISKEEN